ncbi:hypothetical protein HR059_27150 (plasmid) [Sinorhizobium meliloti WSM1022]|nr:hypothetical protein [Sinorhizobium meliloti]QKN18118.1 hypothetical protein HR059_27150 [Sinorhizobium meliloti WSM1022]MCK3791709.1 hypothetical protein [Sinorhizobium meliloti]MCK3797160.1 hypothetical protein [Sinorhizobium meliloti]MDE3761959.1 hypothetical protein [Sinorhizobium meliloti]
MIPLQDRELSVEPIEQPIDMFGVDRVAAGDGAAAADLHAASGIIR